MTCFSTAGAVIDEITAPGPFPRGTDPTDQACLPAPAEGHSHRPTVQLGSWRRRATERYGASMWDGPFHRVRRDGYEICFVPDAGEDLEDVNKASVSWE